MTYEEKTRRAAYTLLANVRQTAEIYGVDKVSLAYKIAHILEDAEPLVRIRAEVDPNEN